MKKWIMAFVCLMTMVVFTSCSKDDDDFGNSAILGSWTLEKVSSYKVNTELVATFHPNGVLILNGQEIEYSASSGNIEIGKGFGNIIRNLYMKEVLYHKNFINELIKSGKKELAEDEELLWEQREPYLANSIPSNVPLSGKVKIDNKLKITLYDFDNSEKTFTFKRTN